MLNESSRTQLLLGREGMQRLHQAKVAISGIGGVDGFTAEALARSGVGSFALFDDDRICLTNINRQIIATRKTVGRKKVEVVSEHILDINPKAQVELHKVFYGAENADQFDLSGYDYLVDAIDTISSKLVLIGRAKAANVPIISCMGAGNKLDPTRFEIADIYKTSVCPLTRVMRNELRKHGIDSLKVVYSKEPPLTPIDDDADSYKHHCICPPDTKRKCAIHRQVPGNISFVPSMAGLILAGEVVKDLTSAE